MPNIRVYEQQVEAPVAGTIPRDPALAAEMAGAPFKAAATGLQNFGAYVSAQQEQKETSTLAANAALTQAQLTNDLADAVKNAKPGEETSKKFIEEKVAPALENLGAGIETTAAKNMLIRIRGEMAGHFSTAAHADQANIDGEWDVQKYITMENGLTAGVYKDPTSYDINTKLGDIGIAERGGLGTVKQAELSASLHKKLAVARITGIAETDPAAAQKELDSGQYSKDINAAEAETLTNHIRALADAKKSADNAARVEQTRQNKEEVNKAGNQITATTVRDDGSLAVPPDFFKQVVQMSQMPNADVGQTRAMIDYGRAVIEDQQRGRPAITDPVAYDDLTSRMFLEASDPNHLSLADVYRSRADRHLSDKDFSFIHGAVVSLAKDPSKALQMRQFNDIAAGLKGYIDKSSPFLGQVNAVTADKYMQFKRDAKPIFDREITKGTPLNDIEKQIRAIVPTYAIGKKEAIQAIKSYATTGLVPAAPVGNRVTRQPGESADDFLKRAK